MAVDLNSLDGNPGTTASADDGFTLASVLSVLKKRLWLILGIIIAVPSLVAFIVSKQPKVFESVSSIVIESTAPQYLGENFRDVVDLETSWWGAQERMQTELHVLKSYSQAVAVAQALCVVPKDGGLAPLQQLVPGLDCKHAESAAPMLQGLLKLDPVKDSQVVNLVVDGSDPQLTTTVVNTMAEVYTRRNLEHRLNQSEGAATWLGDEYGDLTAQLNAAENALIEFKRKNNVIAVAIEDQQNDLSNRRKKISDQLSIVDVSLIGLRAQRAEYAILRSDNVVDSVSPGVTDSPVVAKLKESYLNELGKLAEMRGRYLDKHPALIAEQTRIESIRGDLKHEAELAGKSVEAQYETVMKEQHDLKSALDVATHEALQLEQRAIEYNRLKRNFDRLAHLSEQVGGRERETSLAGHLKTNNVRVLDAAMVPSSSIAPNVPKAVGMSVVAALALALGLVFLLEVLDATVKTQEDVERKGLSFLGLIPTISPDDRSPETPAPPGVAELVRAGSKDLYTLTRPKSSVAECCRAIRTNLLFMTPDKPARSIVVTSAGPEEGKTTTAVSLAISLAQSGLRVLLVDTDMRRPRLHKAFGVPSTGAGVSKAVVGEGDVLSMVRETGVPNLSLLPCGALPPNPAELLHATRFARIVQTLTESYDRVLFDSPPIGAVTDAVILSQLTEGTILVAKAGKTTRESLGFAIRSLKSSGNRVNVLGCVLNDLDVKRTGKYGYNYYARYGYYYRQEDASTPPTA